MQYRKWLPKLFLVTLGCFGLSFAFAKMSSSVHTKEGYPEDVFNSYAVSSGQLHPVSVHKKIPAEAIHRLRLKLIATGIEIRHGDADEVAIDLEGQYPGEGTPLREEISGDVLNLTVREKSEQGPSFFNFDLDAGAHGNLVITIPDRVQDIGITTVSSDGKISVPKMDTLNIKSVSGDLNIESDEIHTLGVKSVSGALHVKAAVKNLEAKTVSGDVEVYLTNADPQVGLKSTSGSMTVHFKDAPDVDVNFSSISGSVELDHAFGDHDISGRQVHLTLGAGHGSLSAKTISGDMKIQKY